MSNRIAIIGSSEQQNPLILKAKEMGCETHVFAWETGDAPGEKTADFFYPISVNNKEKILEKCRELDINAVASIGSDMASLSAAYVAEEMRLVHNSYRSVEKCVNKEKFRDLINAKGINQPKYIVIKDAIPNNEIRKMQYPMIVKPIDRSSGRGITKVYDEQELLKAINKAREVSFCREAIIEEFVEGKLFSAECVSVNGIHNVITCTKRNVIEKEGLLYTKSYEEPAIVPTIVDDKLDEYCRNILEEVGIQRGLSSVEFIIDKNKQIYVIEICPYLYADYVGSHLLSLSKKFDALKAVIDISFDRIVTVENIDTKQVSKVEFVYSRDDKEKIEIELLNNKQRKIIDKQFYSGLSNLNDVVRCGHYIWCEPYKEFGGCPRYHFDEKYENGDILPNYDGIALNSEYAAFWYSLELMNLDVINMPYYCSATWVRIAKKLGKKIKFYHIGLDFLPLDLTQKDNEAVLLVNYHGMCETFFDEYTKIHKNVIIDNTMAFFSKTIDREGVFCVYSYRKFFDVPDGAYLVSKGFQDIKKIQLDISYDRAKTLLQSFELGESATYRQHQADEQQLTESFKRMSGLTEKMLKTFNFENERKKRKNNFNELNKNLSRYQCLNLRNDVIPQWYPLLLKYNIRDYLIERNIFVPLMWRKFLTEDFDGTSEKVFSERLLLLPIDTRYTVEDMKIISNIILDLI